MNWYIAKLVYRVICGEGNHTPQFDEQVRLIKAEDELHAFHKARLIGDNEAVNGMNDTTIAVRWKFIDVSELLPLVSMADGAEIYGTVKEELDADMYIRTTQKKAIHLLQMALNQFTGLNALTFDN